MADRKDLALAAERFLAVSGQTYTVDEETGNFLIDFPLEDEEDGVLRSLLAVRDGGYDYAIPLPVPCEEDCLREAALLAAAVNHRMPAGRIDLDIESGQMTYLAGLEAETPPAYEKLESLVLAGQALMKALAGPLTRVGQGLSEAMDELDQ